MKKAWSYSHLNKYETCAKLYYHTNVVPKDSAARVFEAKTEVTAWGEEVHKAFELYYKKGVPFPKAMKKFADYAKIMDALPGADIKAELKLALTEDLKPTGFFDKNVWCRAVVDALKVHGTAAWALDWKTGKRRDGSLQLMLTAAILFSIYPEVDKVTTAFVWLKEPLKTCLDKATYNRADLPEMWGQILPRVNHLHKAIETGNFPAEPGFLCKRFCPVKQCEYNGT